MNSYFFTEHAAERLNERFPDFPFPVEEGTEIELETEPMEAGGETLVDAGGGVWFVLKERSIVTVLGETHLKRHLAYKHIAQ